MDHTDPSAALPARRRRVRPWTVGLPSSLAVLGVVTIGPNHLLGAAFIAAALVATGAAVVAVRRPAR